MQPITFKNQILLVGAGYMAQEYAKVLKTLKKPVLVIGRGRKSADSFTKQTGLPVITGGLARWLKDNSPPAWAIVASTEDTIGKNALLLIGSGVREILVEKPGGFDFKEIRKVASVARQRKTNVYVGYNRRFYASVKKAQDIIKKDGGVTSFTFDFTELGWKVSKLKTKIKIKQEWFLHNSTHVLDLAFHLCGSPKHVYAVKKGALPWHKAGSVFVGTGVTVKNIPFSYHANWDSPGRWNLEIQTKKHKLILKPLEKLQTQKLGSFDTREINIKDKLDVSYKPGLYKEVESFFGKKIRLCTIEEQVKNLTVYNNILKGIL